MKYIAITFALFIFCILNATGQTAKISHKSHSRKDFKIEFIETENFGLPSDYRYKTSPKQKKKVKTADTTGYKKSKMMDDVDMPEFEEEDVDTTGGAIPIKEQEVEISSLIKSSEEIETLQLVDQPANVISSDITSAEVNEPAVRNNISIEEPQKNEGNMLFMGLTVISLCPVFLLLTAADRRERKQS